MAAVKLAGIHKAFGEVRVIHGVDCDIADGEFIVILGPSGCGKSTLLRIIAGLEAATAGDVFIGGVRVNDVEPKDRNIAMVFQNYALYPHMSVYDNMSYGLRIRGLPKRDIEARVKQVAEILELGDLLARKPRQLSGGQRQRVAMGRAIVRQPQLFLFDEPLSNLDAKLRVQMRVEIKKLHSRIGTTSVYVTHDQVEAMTLGDRLIVMNGGLAEQIGTPMEVYAKPASTFVAGFIGSPPMNLVGGTLRAGVLEAAGGARIRLGAVAAAFEGRELLLGFRPEHLEPCAAAEANIDIDVDLVEPLGADTLAYGHVGKGTQGARIAARLHESVDARTGHLALRFDVRRAHYFDPQSGKRIDS